MGVITFKQLIAIRYGECLLQNTLVLRSWTVFGTHRYGAYVCLQQILQRTTTKRCSQLCGTSTLRNGKGNMFHSLLWIWQMDILVFYIPTIGNLLGPKQSILIWKIGRWCPFLDNSICIQPWLTIGKTHMLVSCESNQWVITSNNQWLFKSWFLFAGSRNANVFWFGFRPHTAAAQMLRHANQCALGVLGCGWMSTRLAGFMMVSGVESVAHGVSLIMFSKTVQAHG